MVYFVVISVTQIIVSNNRTINEWIRRDVELAMVYFKVQPWNLHGKAERNHERLVRIFSVLVKILNRHFLITHQMHYCLSQFIRLVSSKDLLEPPTVKQTTQLLQSNRQYDSHSVAGAGNIYTSQSAIWLLGHPDKRYPICASDTVNISHRYTCMKTSPQQQLYS
jgi:hypothetical protein